ncbi:MAG: ATP-binding protein [Defluviitaleaceae bacterium]|nr:ATP-binding protein [Defluviitaleaceae bacterium]
MKFGLKTQIIAPVIAVSVMLVAVIFLFVSISMARLADTFSYERVVGASQTARAHLAGLEAQSSIVSYSAGINSTFINYLRTHDIGGMMDFLLNQVSIYGVDSFVITDEHGTVLLRTHAPERYGDDGSDSPGIATAMTGARSSIYVSNLSFPIAMASSTPVFHDGELIGTLSASYNFSSLTYVDSFSELFNAEVTFFSGAKVVSTSMRDEYGRRADGFVPPDEVLEAVLGRGETFSEIKTLYGEEYHMFYYPLFGHVDNAIGMFSIGFSRAQTNATVTRARTVILIIGTASLITSVLLLLFAIMRFFRPFELLIKNVWDISDTNDETLLVYGVDRDDEVGDLSRNIQHMRNLLVMLSQEMQIATDSKSSFLSNMSHEIRTPMNAIIGMATIGMASPDLWKKHSALEKIDVASKHLLGVINDVLDMSKIEANRFDLSLVRFNLKSAMDKMMDVLRVKSDEKEQTIVVSIDPNLPEYVIGDDQRLMQVITNLVSNAVKFTPVGGTVSLNVIMLERNEYSCVIRVDVVDTGIGMDEEQLSRIFSSFVQAEADTSRTYGGTGLGLSISKQLVNLMGGEIWVNSVPNQGSTFSFTLSLTYEDADTRERTEEPPPTENADNTTFEGFRILLVEDIDINTEIVLALLEDTGLIIDCAVDGEEAVAMYTANPDKYGLIFMDIQMPKMDGYEATRRIRLLEQPEGKPVPIVAMTANVFKEEIENCLNAGMNDHVGKPIDKAVLITKLRKYL